jgi:hypothetical protein
MAWDVEYTDEFEEWFGELDLDAQGEVGATVDLLVEHGPSLGFPKSTKVVTSRYGAMRELRVQYAGRPLRILYAFDPRRTAILLLGGDKTGDDRWYEVHVPAADRLYAEHLETLRKEGLI